MIGTVSKPADAAIGEGGLAAVLSSGKSRIVLLQVTPDLLGPAPSPPRKPADADPGHWQKAKVLQVYTALLAGQGAAFSAPLDMTWTATAKPGAPSQTYPLAQGGGFYMPFDPYLQHTW